MHFSDDFGAKTNLSVKDNGRVRAKVGQGKLLFLSEIWEPSRAHGNFKWILHLSFFLPFFLEVWLHTELVGEKFTKGYMRKEVCWGSPSIYQGCTGHPWQTWCFVLEMQSWVERVHSGTAPSLVSWSVMRDTDSSHTATLLTWWLHTKSLKERGLFLWRHLSKGPDPEQRGHRLLQ